MSDPNRSSRAHLTGARPARRGLLAAVAVLLLAAASAAAAIVQGAGFRSAGGNVGHLTLTGPLKKSLTLPKGWKTKYAGVFVPTCTFTSNGPTSLQFTLYNVKLALNGHPRLINSMLVTLTVARDGDTETLAPTSTVDSANVFEATANLEASIRQTNYSWSSISGKIATSASGKSGSLQGVLPPSPVDPGKATGQVSMKLSWSSCRTPPKL